MVLALGCSHCYASNNVEPGRTQGFWGAFGFHCLSHPLESVPQSSSEWRYFIFLQRRMKPNLIITHDCLCGHLETVLVKQNTGVSEASNCFQLIKHLLVTNDFQYKLMEHLTLWRLHGSWRGSITVLWVILSFNKITVKLKETCK